MVFDQIIHGKTILLRAVDVSDAEFIVQIRNSNMAKYLHAVTPAADAQAEWIKQQRQRKGDYYFIICDLKGNQIGTVGLSGIEGGCGETSRFISYGSPLQNTEANILITDFAFDTIGLNRIEGYVAVQNTGVISLQKKFGYIFEDQVKQKDGINVRFARLDKADYWKKRKKIIKILDTTLYKTTF